jgi:hypothetical protein
MKIPSIICNIPSHILYLVESSITVLDSTTVPTTAAASAMSMRAFTAASASVVVILRAGAIESIDGWVASDAVESLSGDRFDCASHGRVAIKDAVEMID